MNTELILLAIIIKGETIGQPNISLTCEALSWHAFCQGRFKFSGFGRFGLSGF